MRNAILAAIATVFVAGTAMADSTFLSFKGRAALDAIKAGSVKETVRLHDRTQAPSSLKVGLVLPLINGDKVEDARKPEEQIAANAYGKVEIVTLRVSKFEALPKKEQDEFGKYYDAKQIKDAKGIVTVIGMKFKK